MLALTAGACDRALVDAALLSGVRSLVRHELVIGSVGNLSARVGGNVRITPTRVSYEAMVAEDLVTVDLDGELIEGRHAPSRELPLHLAVYRDRTDVQAIVHTHSPHAVAWSFLGRSLVPAIEEQRYYGIGDVHATEPAPAGEARLAIAVVAALGDSRAVLLARHGVVAVGETVDDAILTARVVEHHAQIAWLLRGDEDTRSCELR